METPDRTASSSHQLQSPLPPSETRLWRPAAQRNLRNQWSKLASYRSQWVSSSSAGRSSATSLVNTYLSRKFIPSMELGVLSDMPDVRKKASSKLLKQQELYRSKLLSSYKDLHALKTNSGNNKLMRNYVAVVLSFHIGANLLLDFSEEESYRGVQLNVVAVVTHMVNTSSSMRCYVKGTNNSPLIQFSYRSEDKNDAGDGGEIPRLLLVELFTISCEAPQVNEFCWLNELYPGEFDDLRICNLYSKDTSGPVTPRLMEGKSDMPTLKFNSQPNHENLQGKKKNAGLVHGLTCFMERKGSEVEVQTMRVSRHVTFGIRASHG
ncbi:unnamed protein product [Dovyalis caffra]|uniref:Uncharacterized protein n=1 Tax=Dovyalis caffra TaxID=77055 RepID=A0AAV1SM54_9ROSI|nr:unnamed protein product [Dovyalis caffra]